MKYILYILLMTFVCAYTIAGEDASGPIPYKLDLSQQFTTCKMTEKDKRWVSSLVKNFKYNSEVVHFVKTTIPLEKSGSIINGAVYQAIEMPDHFYIINCDAILKIGEKWPYDPAVGGFSMHAQKNRNFIVTLNFQRGGVPFLSGSEVIKGVVTWKGNEFNRFK